MSLASEDMMSLPASLAVSVSLGGRGHSGWGGSGKCEAVTVPLPPTPAVRQACQAPCRRSRFPTRASRLLALQLLPSHRGLPSPLPAAAGATFERLTLDRVVCSKGSCVLPQHAECCRPSVFSGGLVPGHPSPPRGYQNAQMLKSRM